MNDRFEKLTEDYGKLFIEVYKEKGSDYMKFQESVFDNVKNVEPDFKNTPILDIGTGDGLTLQAFVKAGCKDLTGLDLNPEMLKVAKKKLGNNVIFIVADATDLKMFKTEEFPIIISAMCIHNIPKIQRKLFWNEIKRLKPKVFCFCEKIEGKDHDNYINDINNEIEVMKNVFEKKYGLIKESKEWQKHYLYDEQNDVKLWMDEIYENLSDKYKLEIVFEEGAWKTILARRK